MNTVLRTNKTMRNKCSFSKIKVGTRIYIDNSNAIEGDTSRQNVCDWRHWAPSGINWVSWRALNAT